MRQLYACVASESTFIIWRFYKGKFGTFLCSLVRLLRALEHFLRSWKKKPFINNNRKSSQRLPSCSWTYPLHFHKECVTVSAEVAQIFGPGVGAFPLSAFSFYQFPFIYDGCMWPKRFFFNQLTQAVQIFQDKQKCFRISCILEEYFITKLTCLPRESLR